MCVIVNKKKGIKLPSEDTLKKCFTDNPDGAGIAYTLGTNKKASGINIIKGLMTWDDFWKEITMLKRKYGDDLTRLSMQLHFRITTHGGTCPENTHPFPLTNDTLALQETRLKNLPMSVCHNGVVSSVSVPKTSVLSDTQVFIKSQLYPISTLNNKWYLNDDVMTMIDELIASKLSIMNTNGEIYTIGEFYTVDGVEYSNLYWQYSYTYFKRNANKLTDWAEYYGIMDDDNCDVCNSNRDLLGGYFAYSLADILNTFYDSKTKTFVTTMSFEGYNSGNYFEVEKDKGTIYVYDTTINDYFNYTLDEFKLAYKDEIFGW